MKMMESLQTVVSRNHASRLIDALLQSVDGLLRLPVLWRRPAIARLTLRSARGARLALVVCALFLVLAAPPLARRVARTLYPEQRDLLGLVKKNDPRARQAARRTMILFVLGSGMLVLLAFGRAIPESLRRASEQARRREEEGDGCLDLDPVAAAHCYREALGLCADPERSAELVRKLKSLPDSGDPTEPPSRTKVPAKTVAASSAAEGPSRVITDLPGARRDNPAPDRYRVESEVGRGAMGVVYAAYDPVLDRRVALKKLPDWLAKDQNLRTRFRQEARALARLTHPGIVQVYDFIEDRAGVWMVLELITGGDLAVYLEQHAPLPVDRVCALGIDLAEALYFAHSQGVVHRDFKPSNVLLDPAGRPKITDFGLAKLRQSSALTQEGTVLGSPLYMSPEQAAGKPADPRSDIYSLGISLYEMLTGRPPFDGDTSQVLAQHLTQPPPAPRGSNPDIPERVEEIILQMLSKDPEQRFGDARAAVSGLRPLAAASRVAHTT